MGAIMNGLSKLAKKQYESSVEQIETKSKGITQSKNEIWPFVIHDHKAKLRGQHFDLRLGDKKSGTAHSWVVSKMPAPGESTWAIRQPGHLMGYMDFKGDIKSGYGAGRVDIARNGLAKIIRAKEGEGIKFILPKARQSEEYSLVSIGKGKYDNMWKLFNRSTKKEIRELYKKKKSYKKIKSARPDKPGEVWQPKIDGAQALIYLKKGDHPRILSYRKSVSGEAIDHTFKISKSDINLYWVIRTVCGRHN